MLRAFRLLALTLAAACEAPSDRQASPAALPAGALSPGTAANALDDGTFLGRIDPLGGRWRVERVGSADLARFDAWVNFSEGGFLNHGAGCAGGHPAFYRLEGDRITISRREPVRIGKCPENGRAAADSERQLAQFLDQAVRWRPADNRTMTLTAADGTQAVLTRPVEPHPELAGRWIIETIGGRPLITEVRPPTLSVAMGNIGVVADCNSIGGQFTIPAPGRIEVRPPLMGTAIGCGPEDSAEDALMTRALTAVKTYRLQDARLMLGGGFEMVLRRPPPPNRRLAGDYESCGNTLLGGYHEGPITLAIGERTITDNAGCTADYRADGPDLTIRLRSTPACAAPWQPFVPGEPVGVGGAISTLAVTRPDGFGFAEDGRLILRTSRGHLSMCRKGTPRPFGS